MISPRKAVTAMSPYKPPTDGRTGRLRLDFNENTVGCSPKVIEALKTVTPDFLATYPEYRELRGALGKYFNVSADQVLTTDGTDEAIKNIIEVFIEKGVDEIIIPSPTYTMFPFYAQLNEARIKTIPYNSDLSFPTEQVIQAISKTTKIVVLVNPNNPTGTSIKSEDVVRIVEKARENQSLVLIDEAYYQYFGRTDIPLIKTYNNVVVIQTFSKAFGLAGLRLGCILSNKETIAVLKKALSPYSVNILATLAAKAALQDKAYVETYVSQVKESKKLLYAALEALNIPSYPSDANFMLVKIGNQAQRFCDLLRERGILVRNRSSDLLLEGCVRITLGTVEQTKKLISELENVIKDIRPLLIFDMDGVLVDVSNSYRVAIQKTAEQFIGGTVTPEEIQLFKEKGGCNNDWDLTMAIIESRGIKAERKNVIGAFQERYLKLMPAEKWLFEKTLLKNLSAQYRLVIFTGRPREEAFFALKNNCVEQFFDSVIAMEDVEKQKPDPEGLLKLKEMYSNQEACYFGDSVDDIASAVSANVNPIGVFPPQNKSEQLKTRLQTAGARIILKDINQIKEALS
ncbi:MAG: histidinol-phosphate transaminase [Nanoarchaeota archaeon]|nr:histidinol-phosphate transaminase [Nanoarchaeota archaeon]